ncbi:hypothetical protein B9Z65_5221 [Elsinoe australis]|uniref:Uncharacterized protein n=1 Tax=Elsinoe australis TaxID=40998 RepID=A0A2P7ZDF4_9PEZI|nr:hypothetical protein B9Z65_5221 [Elsinoe australis]
MTAYPSYCRNIATIAKDYSDSSSSASSLGTIYKTDALPLPNWCHNQGMRLAIDEGCRVNLGDATMMYWPTTSRGDSCTTQAQNSPQIPSNMTAAGAQVVTINGTAYTSPYVYITYRGITYTSSGTKTHGITTTSIPSPDPPHLLTTALHLTEPNTDSPALTTAHIPVTAEPAAPSVILSVPSAPTITLGPAPSPAASRPVQTPGIGGIIASVINQPAGNPQQSLEALQQPPSQSSSDPGSDQGSGQDGNDPGVQQAHPGSSGSAGPGQAAGPPQGQVGSDATPDHVNPGVQPGFPGGKGSNDGRINQPSSSDAENNGKSAASPASQGTGAFIAFMLNRPPTGPAPVDSPISGSSQSEPGSGSRTLDPKTGPNSGDPNNPTTPSEASADAALPLGAMVTLGTEIIMTVQRLPNHAHVLHGSTFYAGDAITTAGHTMSFAVKGVVVDGSSTVSYYAAPYVTVTRPQAAGGAGQQAAVATLPAVPVVGGNMVAYGSEMTVAGKRVTYGSEGLVVGTRTIARPTGTGSVAVTLDGGEVMLISAMTAIPGVQTTGGQAGDGSKGSGETAGTGAGVSPTPEAASGRTAESGASEAVPSRTGKVGNGDVALTTDGKAAKPTFPASSAASGVQNGGTAMAWCLFAFMVGLILS